MPDIEQLKNKIMMNIDVPAFWYLDQSNTLTEPELDYEEKLHKNVIYLKLKKQKEGFGKKSNGPSVYKISDLFTKFGDINVSNFSVRNLLK
jgi:hypothetical protein